MPDEIWNEYAEGKQTYQQLATKYGCSVKTIQRRIDRVSPVRNQTYNKDSVVIMDTTYFGRTFGVMVFMDNATGLILHKTYCKVETNSLYKQGIEKIAQMGVVIHAIVCDGRKGLLGLFNDMPIQMCQFHQVQITTRYLTKRPKTEPSQELRAIALTLTRTSKSSFEQSLKEWYARWEHYLKERTINQLTQKSHYTHKKLRSAYFSLKRNLPWLFTFEDNPSLGIPNTTNRLDGKFSDLKNKLRNHNGLNIDRKKRFIDGFFKA